VSRYQKGKTNLDFTEARDSEWQSLRNLLEMIRARFHRESKTKIYTPGNTADVQYLNNTIAANLLKIIPNPLYL